MRIIVAHFGNKLSREDFCNDRIRRETLNRGLDKIEGCIDGIETVGILNAACVAIFSVPDENVRRLQEFFDSQALIGPRMILQIRLSAAA